MHCITYGNLFGNIRYNYVHCSTIAMTAIPITIQTKVFKEYNE